MKANTTASELNSPCGDRMITTPIKPTTTALQRRMPTCSRKISADIAVTNSGIVNVIDTTSASGIAATAR